MRVAQVLQRDVIVVAPDTPVAEVATLLAGHATGVAAGGQTVAIRLGRAVLIDHLAGRRWVSSPTATWWSATWPRVLLPIVRSGT